MKTTDYRRSTLFLALLVSTSFGEVNALEVGFEGSVSYDSIQSTDNTALFGEQDSELNLGIAQITVFGEQRTRSLNAGFSGEFETRTGFEDEDDTVNTVTRFTGSADVALSAQSLRWYFGNVLTGVRNEDSVRIADDLNQFSRNIFMTGPTYRSTTEGFGTTEARLFYVNQTQEDENLETLYSFSASHQRETTIGSFYGIRFNDIYTDEPDTFSADPTVADQIGEDINRITVSIFNNRARELTGLYTELGATRYQTDDEEVDGLTAIVRGSLTMGPETTLTAEISHSLNDQTIRTVDVLLEGGGDDDGLQPGANGIFAETRFDIGYSINRPVSEIEFSLSVAQLDYRLLTGNSVITTDADSQDQYQGTVEATYARRFGSRINTALSTAYEREEFINQPAYTDAILFSAELNYTLTRTLSLEMSVIYDAAEGVRSQVVAANGAVASFNAFPVDETQTRASIGIRWAPPSRAERGMGTGLVSLQ